MSRILIVEPAVVDKNILEEDTKFFERIASPGTSFKILAPTKGPKSIETEYDKFLAAPEVLKIIKENKNNYDAIMINCFEDLALNAAREIAEIPVLGPGETSMLVACLLGAKFSVISNFDRDALHIAIRVRSLGIESRLASVYGVEIPVLGLEQDWAKTAERILARAKEAIEKDKAEVIVLGCTGMWPVAKVVSEKLDVPLVEPASTTFKMAQLVAELGLKHSKIAFYTPPSYDKIIE